MYNCFIASFKCLIIFYLINLQTTKHCSSYACCFYLSVIRYWLLFNVLNKLRVLKVVYSIMDADVDVRM